MTVQPLPEFVLSEGDLQRPMRIRAVMARNGFGPPGNLRPWDSPDSGWTDPLNDPEIREAVRSFMARLWRICELAE